jgi:tRNA A-37 threonylcarbamoyl transferase component Bud32
MLQARQVLGSYTVVRFLGAGGMGSVYEAEHAVMGTRHALKVLGDQFVGSAAVRERFKRQARLMLQLGAHPHIVRATDLIEADDTLALVLDYADGGDLATALEARSAGLAWTEAWRILQAVVSAVAHAHARGVVHRDLKPENVLLQSGGPWPGVPQVADFGIAKVLGSDSGTRTQAHMGTACYGAPEQFRNAKDVGPEADVWALGMLAWRLVMGRLPVDPEDNGALCRLYEGITEVPRLTTVPDQVAEAVATALQVDPHRRPRDASVLEKLLAHADEPHTAVAPVPAAVARRGPADWVLAAAYISVDDDLPARVDAVLAEGQAVKLDLQPSGMVDPHLAPLLARCAAGPGLVVSCSVTESQVSSLIAVVPLLPPGRVCLQLSGVNDAIAERLAGADMGAVQLEVVGPCELTDAGLAHLSHLVNLTTLMLSLTEVTDAGLAHVSKLVRLTRLYLDFTRVTDAGGAHLSKLVNLRELNLSFTKLTDVGLAHVSRLVGLGFLSLSGTKVTDAGLAHLPKLVNLHQLDLSCSRVTDVGLAHVSKLVRLSALDLSDTQVTDVGLAHVSELVNLWWLDLRGTQMSDAGLVHVSKLSNLMVISIERTQISPAGLAQLSQAFGNELLLN